jgi:hypothetical protein
VKKNEIIPIEHALYLHQMQKDKTAKQHSWEILLIFLFGVIVSLLYCETCRVNWQGNLHVFLFSGILWVILWKGNELMSDYADAKVSWMHQPLSRLGLGLFLHIVYSVLAVAALNIIANWILTSQFDFDFETFIDFSIPAVLITIFISLVLTARIFLFSWRDLAVQHEKLKTEAIASRFSALKNQVNPHFLFNSLNVLTNLVYKDPDQSAEFIQKLADVYRYVLESQDKETVPLADEIAFVESFTYLQKMRFGAYLSVDIDLPNDLHIAVPPLAIQMLVENAIKHNTISKEHPLLIHIKSEEDYLIVKNDLHSKEIVVEKKNGIGLENIRARYQFLTDREVKIKRGASSFKVYLPILHTKR